MAYDKTNWKTGDVVTSAKLNKIEEGIASNSLVVEIETEADGNDMRMNKTASEIYNALVSGGNVLFARKRVSPAEDGNTGYVLYNVAVLLNFSKLDDDSSYEFILVSEDIEGNKTYFEFAATSPSDYPTVVISD